VPMMPVAAQTAALLMLMSPSVGDAAHDDVRGLFGLCKDGSVTVNRAPPSGA